MTVLTPDLLDSFDASITDVATAVTLPAVVYTDEEFLAIPSEIIRLTIKTNQKCFVTRRPGSDGDAGSHRGHLARSHLYRQGNGRPHRRRPEGAGGRG